MNGNPLSRPEIDPSAPGFDTEAVPSVEKDEHRRAWAVAMAATAAPEAVRSVGLGATELPVAWRKSDVSLTDLANEIARSESNRVQSSDMSEGTLTVSRLSAAVSLGELGDVSFVVDRSNQGLSIVVEVSNEQAEARVDAERNTLLRTLRLAGLTVLSFRVLCRREAGTPLAVRGSANHARPSSFQRARGGKPQGSSSEADPEDGDESFDVVG